jgi:lactate racemase
MLADVPAEWLTRVTPTPVSEGEPVLELCRHALEAPVESPTLREQARNARRIAICVSDATRDEPRRELLSALFELLPEDRTTLVVANGTHAPRPLDGNVIPEPWRHLSVVNHDGRREEDMVDLGTTSRGTRVRIQRAITEADLVVCTGRIRPHYFAGWSGGVKSVFPGCAHADDALTNHRMKSDPNARLGQSDDNPCRLDMEEASLLVPGRIHLLNVLCDVDGTSVAAAAGHPIHGHRLLAERARALFEVRAARSPLVCVADRPPVTSSLYQASKLIPPAGALLEPGGTVILLADCSEGTGPLERVNQGIYEIGVKPQLPANHRVLLVSELESSVVEATYAAPRASLREALAAERERMGIPRAVLLWRAGECIAVAEDFR